MRKKKLYIYLGARVTNKSSPNNKNNQFYPLFLTDPQ